jgi:hypothetical protein
MQWYGMAHPMYSDILASLCCWVEEGYACRVAREMARVLMLLELKPAESVRALTCQAL